MDRLSTKGQMIDQIDLRNVPHSGFDRSNHNYGTGRLGTIQPTRVDEVYPGDRIKGKPEIVINFEPLAAPLMGSMVVKQESFFVPYPQLWRHAYKFFTGKNGFNELMPSISPKDIFDVYAANIHSLLWLDIGVRPEDIQGEYSLGAINYNISRIVGGSIEHDKYSSVSISGDSLTEDFQNYVDLVKSTMHNVYDSRKMFDLVQPAIDIFDRYSKSEDLRVLSENLESSTVSFETKQKLCIDFSIVLGGLIHQFFDYFHGPSSLFDYLGWPVALAKNVPDASALLGPYWNSVKNDLFKYCVLCNVLSHGSVHTQEKIESLFSCVPLVFNPFKAYYLIWYWNYRDQLLETDILDPEEDEFLGSAITTNVILYCTLMRQRCWFKDTYTTALTNTGDGNLLVPVSAPDNSLPDVEYYSDNGELINTKDADSAFQSGATICRVSSGSISYKIPMNYIRTNFNPTTTEESSHYLSLDLFDRIKRLRSQVQKRLILGYEVDDVVWSSFMVRMSNVRLHIPEILGRGRDAVQINTIVNNTSTDQQIAGDKTATAWANGQHSEMDYFAEEWGLYMSFVTVMPIQSYAGGMQRLYLKRDPLDYAWPEFATLGMDAVYNCELSALGARLTDQQGLMVFGYQGRYYDLKSRQDEEHGRLLTDLNYLTFSREWDSNNPPKLNYIFVHCWPRLDGFVIDDPTQDVFRYDCYNAHGWERRLPVPSEIVG